jgi:hypothetical protein
MSTAHKDPVRPDGSEHIATWMSPARCRQLLGATRVSRVAFVDGGLPQIVVLNHAVDGDDVVFQTSDQTRLARLTDSGTEIAATIETDSATPAMHAGWSIVASGQLCRTTEAALGAHPSPWRSGAVGVLLRLRVDQIHGQVVGA